MQTSQHIGGFLGLDLASYSSPTLPNVPLLTSARACLHLILQQTKPDLVYVPFYICDTLLEAFKVAQIPFQYYPLNESLELQVLPNLKPNEYFLWVNYFGVKSAYTQQLFEHYQQQLIVDHSQAFFEAMPYTWGFNSARKFMGVPDGAFLFTPKKLELNLPINTDFIYTHLIEKVAQNQEKAYQDFKKNESLMSCDLKFASILSQKLIAHTDFEHIQKKRQNHFQYVHQQLGKYNLLKWKTIPNITPLCYPFLPSKHWDKKVFHQKGFYIPSYWQEVVLNPIKSFTFEKKLAQRLLPLPIDQQCDEKSLKRLVNFILSLV